MNLGYHFLFAYFICLTSVIWYQKFNNHQSVTQIVDFKLEGGTNVLLLLPKVLSIKPRFKLMLVPPADASHPILAYIFADIKPHISNYFCKH